jgi:hypothetical protein
MQVLVVTWNMQQQKVQCHVNYWDISNSIPRPFHYLEAGRKAACTYRCKVSIIRVNNKF